MSLIEREKQVAALHDLIVRYGMRCATTRVVQDTEAIDAAIAALPPADAAPWTRRQVVTAMQMDRCLLKGCACDRCNIIDRAVTRIQAMPVPPTATWRGVFEEALSSYEAALAESNKPWGGADVAVEREAKRIKARLALIAAATGAKAIKGEL